MLPNYKVQPVPEIPPCQWYPLVLGKKYYKCTDSMLSHLFQNFPQFIVIHIVKGFGIVNKAQEDVFSGTLLLFQ